MSETIDLGQRLRLWADELHAIANEELRWEGDNSYSVRRMERVRRIAAELFAAQGVGDADLIERRFADEPWHIAPYPCGDAAIFNARGEILLVHWYAEDNLPPLSPGHAARIEGAFRYRRGELHGAVFDRIGSD